MTASAPRPLLAVVIDTEEEFDWRLPFARANRATRSIPAQAHAQAIFDELGVVPTYVVDHPVATDPDAVSFLRELRDTGRAEIGTHLHPWVSPPHDEEVSRYNSYACNLPPDLERAKIACLTDAIAAAFGARPTVFKAGRYGFGANTGGVLADLGYHVDCSFVPWTSFAEDGGPDYRGVPDQPFWLDADRRLLEVPMTCGFFGLLNGAGPTLHRALYGRRAERWRLPGLMARTGLLGRSRLSPEGISADEQCRLLRAMTRAGRQVFTLTYHSPSLEAGHTPYVRDDADLAAFLAAIRRVLTYFRDDLGGAFTTLTRYRRSLLNGAAAPR